MSGHVFISYGSENSDEANALCAYIEERGVKVWIAPRDVRPGLDYSEALQGAIEGCLAFVVLVTDMANKSPYVRAETEMAFSNSKPIFPVRMTDIKPASGLAFFLKIRHWTDAYGAGRDASLERLAVELQALSGVVPQAGAAAPSAAPQPAPAPAPPAPPLPPAAPADDELLAAAIGPKTAFYLERWRRLDATGAKTSWSWAACFGCAFWLAYRKMWFLMGLFIAATLVLSMIGSASIIMAKITLIATILLSFATGYLGVIWYRKHVSRLIAGTAGLDRTAALAHLRARGGVSRAAVWISLVAAILLLLLVQLPAILREVARQKALQDGTAPSAEAPAAAGAPADSPAESGNGSGGAPALDQTYLVGRWTDEGDCDRAYELTADGRFIAADGGAGAWSLDGDVLTATGPGGSASMRIAPIDQNTMSASSSDGQVGQSTRC